MTESSRSLARAVELAADALADAPAGLLTDFDGTLSPIVTDPALARLVDGAGGALAALAGRLAVVAVITGRAPLDARRMTGVPGLVIAGNHGIEWLGPDADAPEPAPQLAVVGTEVAAALARIPQMAGVTVEEKGLSATVHYRNARDPEAARARIVGALGEVAPRLELRPGRMSLELRPVGLGDKGVAARAIVERYRLRGAVVMGDDVTDLDMFRAIAELREAGTIRAAVIGVGGSDREVPADVAAAADVLLADPAEAASFLAAISR